jgi:DNA-binding MarR family transcriptional regulator
LSDPPDETLKAEIEARKQQSFAQLLFRCARLTNELAVSRVRETTGQDLRTAHTNLFPHIDLEGTRLTEIARRAGISKQAVGQLVDELVEMGALERVPDPTDGRAKLIRFHQPPDGPHAIMAGLATLMALERELAEAMGADHARNLHAALLALQDALEKRSP